MSEAAFSQLFGSYFLSRLAEMSSDPALRFTDLVKVREFQQEQEKRSLTEENSVLKERLAYQKAGDCDDVAMQHLFDELRRERETNAAFRDSTEKRIQELSELVTSLQLERKSSEVEGTPEKLVDLSERVKAVESDMRQTMNSVDSANKFQSEYQQTVRNMEERLLAVESLPRSVRNDLNSFDDKIAAFIESVSEERAGISVLRNDVLERHETEIERVVSSAGEALERLGLSATEFEERALGARDLVLDMVKEEVSEKVSVLEGDIGVRLEEHRDAIRSIHEDHDKLSVDLRGDISRAIETLSEQVQSSVDHFQELYHTKVNDQLQRIVLQAEEFERERRENFPTLESDRVEIMKQELSSTTQLFDDMMRKVALFESGEKPLSTRVEELEACAAGLQTCLDVLLEGQSSDPKIHFSIETQTMEGKPSYDAQFGEELWHAQSQLHLSAANCIEEGSVPDAPDAPDLPAQRMEKEAELLKIQDVLTKIQHKFYVLEQREASECDSSTVQTQELSHLIARQKEAIYLKERELVARRNQLWKELGV